MEVTTELISAAKLARRMTTNAFDSEVERLLNAAIQDLGCAGVVLPTEATALAVQACITYFLANFGEPDHYDRLKASYDEQKAQLRTRTGYTVWTITETATDTEDAATAYAVTVTDGTVENDAAEILEAIDSGKIITATVDGALFYPLSVVSASDDTNGEYVVVNYADSAKLRVLRSGSASWSIGTFEIHLVMDESANLYNIAESRADILAAYNDGKELLLVDAEKGWTMFPDYSIVTDSAVTLGYRLYARPFAVTLGSNYIQLSYSTATTTNPHIWQMEDPVQG